MAAAAASVACPVPALQRMDHLTSAIKKTLRIFGPFIIIVPITVRVGLDLKLGKEIISSSSGVATTKSGFVVGVCVFFRFVGGRGAEGECHHRCDSDVTTTIGGGTGRRWL